MKCTVNDPVLGMYIDLIPRGIRDGPSSLADVVNAMRCVLTALTVRQYPYLIKVNSMSGLPFFCSSAIS